MVTIDEMNEMLNDIVDDVPEPFFRELNGGVTLSPETRLHAADVAGNLYTLGEYQNDRYLGRLIVLFYGSFCKAYPHAKGDALRAQLRRVLLHEFTHHVESLAGERGLEYKDAASIRGYLKRMGAIE